MRAPKYLWMLYALAMASQFGARPSWGQDDPIQTALTQGKPEQAYVIASQRLNEEMGDPEFDFLYGLAAVNSGHAEEAVFAFERVLLARPQDARARIELARAHFMLGDYDAAELGFKQVQAQNPPPNVQHWIDQYLSKITERRSQQNNALEWLASLTAGHDTNVNSAPGIDSYSTDIITLTPDDTLDDQYAEIMAGANYTHKLSKTRAWCGGFGVAAHNNIDTNTYDTNTVTLTGCYSWGETAYRWKTSGQAQWLTLDSEHYRDLYAIALELAAPIGNNLRSTSQAQLGITRYPEQESRDMNFITLNSSLLHPLNSRHALSAALHAGHELAADDEGDANARTYGGAQSQWLWQVSARSRTITQLSYQHARYGAEYAFEDTVRSDGTLTAGVLWNYQIGKRWSGGAEYRYTRADSNIELFTYDRNLFQITFRYQTN